MKKHLVSALTVVASIVAALIAVYCAAPAPSLQPFSGTVLTGGTGISKVTTNSPGLLAGSGTTGNPLTATLSVSSPISGTGSSGSPLTSSGDIAGVTAGSGLTGGGTSGTVTLDIGAGSGITLGADEIAVNLGSGLTFSAGAVVPNLTGATCSNGQGVTALAASGAGTCGNVGFNRYEGTHVEWNDEWTISACVTGSPCGSYGNCTTSGTGAACGGQNNGTTTRPGIFDLVCGTATNRLALISSGAQSVNFGAGSWTAEATVGFPTLSDNTNSYAAIFGFGDVTTGLTQTDGCYFLYDERNTHTNGANSGNAQKWQCVCGDNTGSPTRTVYLMDGSTVSDESFTTVDAPVAALTLPDTNIYRLKLVMTGTTRAEFFVNGTKRCNINTHIPSGASRLTGMMLSIVGSAGVARTMSVDQTRFAVDLTSARSP